MNSRHLSSTTTTFLIWPDDRISDGFDATGCISLVTRRALGINFGYLDWTLLQLQAHFSATDDTMPCYPSSPS